MKQVKWHDRLGLSARNPLNSWDSRAHRRKVVTPLMGGGILAVDHLQNLMEMARHDSEEEIDSRELFNYVASAHLLDKVPNKDGKTIQVDKIRKGFYKPRLAPILEVAETREPFDRTTGDKIPIGQWDASDYHLQDQGGYEWKLTERLVDFCAVHFCSG